MKRLFLSILILATACFSQLNAAIGDIIFSCDFEEGLPDNWDNLDLDDVYIAPYFWNNTGYPYLGEGSTEQLKTAWALTEDKYTKKCLVSPSLFTVSSARANDWLVSPSFKVSEEGAFAAWMSKSVTEQNLSTYEARVIEAEDYKAIMQDYYNGDIKKSQLSDLLVEKSTLVSLVSRESENWTKRSAVIDESFAGKKMHFILRDNDQTGLGVLVDNIYVTEGKNGLAAVEGPWVENFEDGNVSLYWAMDVTGWKPSYLWADHENLPAYKGLNMVWFDAFYTSKGDGGCIQSFLFKPLPTSYILEFELEKVLYAPNYIYPDLGLFLEVSTDGGQTYISSDENYLLQMPAYANQNIGTTTGKVKLTKNLASYIGQDIKIRLRAVSNKGGEDFFLWKVALIESANVSPVVEFISPEDGKVNVALNAEISVQFDRDIEALDLSKITLKEKGGALVDIETDINSDKVFLYHGDLKYGTEYEVLIPFGSINTLSAPIAWSFTTTTLPELQSVTPADESEAVEIDAEVSLTFDKKLTIKDTDKINIRDLSGKYINISKVEVKGSKVIITHDDFKYNTLYVVTIPGGVLEGMDSEYKWSFTTRDTQSMGNVKKTYAVYPTLSSGNVTVKTEAGVKVKIADISGRILSEYLSNGVLDLELEYANGIYIILIEGVKTESHKVVLKR